MLLADFFAKIVGFLLAAASMNELRMLVFVQSLSTPLLSQLSKVSEFQTTISGRRLSINGLRMGVKLFHLYEPHSCF